MLYIHVYAPGPHGLFKSAEGLTIAYLSGVYAANAYSSMQTNPGLSVHYTRGELATMCDMGKVLLGF